MGKVKRGVYVFIASKGDHPPRHVHFYKDGRLVVKWDLENGLPMQGKAHRKLVELIRELDRAGVL